MKIRPLVFCSFLICLFFSVVAAAAEGDAFIFSLQGDVFIDEGEGERLLAAGERIASAGTVRTGIGGRVTIVFPDDSQLTLGPGKTVSLGEKAEEKRKGLRGLWNRITGKQDEAEYTAAFGTVGAVRGEEDPPPEDWPLYEDEQAELEGEIEAIREQFSDPGTESLLAALTYEEYEQFAAAAEKYREALELLPESTFLYDMAIDFFMKAEQYERAELLRERKRAAAESGAEGE